MPRCEFGEDSEGTHLLGEIETSLPVEFSAVRQCVAAHAYGVGMGRRVSLIGTKMYAQ